MMDKYGYIGIETLLNFCENSKDHAVTPNDFMRMNRIRTPETIRCMDDPISRQAAIDVLSFGKEILSRALDDTYVVGAEREKYSWGLELIESYIKDIEELPPAQPDWEEMLVICDNCGHAIHMKRVERRPK